MGSGPIHCDHWHNGGNLWVEHLHKPQCTKGKHILDYGSGVGIESLALARLGNTVSIADINAANLDLVERVLRVSGYGHALRHKLLLNASYPYFVLPEGETVDVFYSNGVLHHTPELPRILQRVSPIVTEVWGSLEHLWGVGSQAMRRQEGQVPMVLTEVGSQGRAELYRYCSRRTERVVEGPLVRVPWAPVRHTLRGVEFESRPRHRGRNAGCGPWGPCLRVKGVRPGAGGGVSAMDCTPLPPPTNAVDAGPPTAVPMGMTGGGGGAGYGHGRLLHVARRLALCSTRKRGRRKVTSPPSRDSLAGRGVTPRPQDSGPRSIPKAFPYPNTRPDDIVNRQ